MLSASENESPRYLVAIPEDTADFLQYVPTNEQKADLLTAESYLNMDDASEVRKHYSHHNKMTDVQSV